MPSAPSAPAPSYWPLLQLGRWRLQHLLYSTTNTLGAGLILVSLAVEPNLPSIFIESFQ